MKGNPCGNPFWRIQFNCDASVLMAKLVSVGGNNITKRSICHTSVKFSGETIAEFLVMNSSGSIAKSGVVSCYGGEFGEGDLQSLPNAVGKAICTPQQKDAKKKTTEATAQAGKQGQR